MTLPLTPDVLKGAYELLCAAPPFNRWNMPDSDDVTFKVAHSPNFCGWYNRQNGRHVIAISRRSVGHTATLLATMAHEMIHLYQGDTRMETPGAQHNAAFVKLAERVAKVHGFDPKLF